MLLDFPSAAHDSFQYVLTMSSTEEIRSISGSNPKNKIADLSTLRVSISESDLEFATVELLRLRLLSTLGPLVRLPRVEH
jgi:hypothetical protein